MPLSSSVVCVTWLLFTLNVKQPNNVCTQQCKNDVYSIWKISSFRFSKVCKIIFIEFGLILFVGIYVKGYTWFAKKYWMESGAYNKVTSKYSVVRFIQSLAYMGWLIFLIIPPTVKLSNVDVKGNALYIYSCIWTLS